MPAQIQREEKQSLYLDEESDNDLWTSLIYHNTLTIWKNKLCVFTEVNSKLSKVSYLNGKIRIKSGNKFLGLRMEKLFCIKLTDIKQ